MRQLGEIRKNKIIQSIIILKLLFPMELIYATGIKIDESTDKKYQAGIEKTKNAIDLIDIVDAQNGISHNKFLEYNVSDRGIILNNSKELTMTSLAGLVDGNANLKNQADLIITEITGTGRSNINGYTEIAGKKADYVLANPNGVFLNGAGFINTNRVTVTTGKINRSEDLKFRVEDGLIEVGNKGISTENLEYFTLLSRAAKINGNIAPSTKEIKTKEIEILTGKNEYDYKTKKLTTIDSESDGKYAVAIDTSDLGGIIGNKIKLIGTEKGLGVNTKNLVALEDIKISADGRIVSKDMLSKNIDLDSKEVEIQGSVRSENLKSTNLLNKGTVVSDNISVEEKLINKGTLIGEKSLNLNEVSNESQILSNEKISIKNLENKEDGTVSAKEISATEILNLGKVNGSVETDILLNKNSVTGEKIKINKEFDNTGNILSNVLHVNSDLISNEGEIRAKDINFVSKILSNKGKLISEILNLNILEKILNGGYLETGNFSTEGKLKNTGDIITDNIELKNDVENSGFILGNLKTSGEKLENTGNIQGEKMEINSKVINSKDILAKNLKINGDIENSGLIGSKTISITGDLVNKKSVIADEVSIDSNDIKNTGDIKSVNNIEIETKTLTNESEILANKNVNIRIKDSDLESGVKNSGKIAGNISLAGEDGKGTSLSNEGELAGNLDLKLNEFTNSGILKGDIKIDYSADSDLDLTGEYVATNLEIQTKKSIKNAKELKASGNINLNSKEGNILNEGRVIAGADIKLAGKTIENKNKIISRGNLEINTDRLINESQILSGNNLVIDVNDGFIENAENKLIYAKNNMNMSGNNIENSGTILTSDGDINLNFLGHVANIARSKFASGLIKAGNNLNVTANDFWNQGYKYKNGGFINLYDWASVSGYSYGERFLDASVVGGERIIANWGSFNFETFFWIANGGTLENYRTRSWDGDWHYGAPSGDTLYYEITGTVKVDVQKDPIRVKQASVEGKNINMNLGRFLHNRGIISATENINIKAPQIVNQTEVLKETGVSEYSGKAQAVVISTNLVEGHKWYSDGPRIYDIKTEEYINVSEDKAKIMAGGTISLEGSIINTDTATGEKISGYSDTIEEKKDVNQTNKEEIENEAGDVKTVFDETKIDDISGKIDEEKKLADDKINEAKEGSDSSQEDAKKDAEENKAKEEETVKTLEEKKAEEARKIQNQIERQTKLDVENYIELPTDEDGIFKTNKDFGKGSNNNPLIETNIEFIDKSKYYGSDYFFEKIDYTPDDIRSIGDAYYETTLINDVIKKNFDRIDNKNEIETMKTLIDNGAAVHKELNLEVGKEPTKEQLSKLENDIVWYVEKEIQGYIVLVPQLYVGKNADKKEESSVISGNNVLIKNGKVENTGSIIAKDTILVDASEITNKYSTNRAKIEGENVYLTADKNIENMGSVIKGKNLLIDSKNGDVKNETLIKENHYKNSESYETDIIGVAKIEGDTVNIKANKYNQKGAILKGKDGSIETTEGTNFETVELKSRTKKEGYQLYSLEDDKDIEQIAEEMAGKKEDKNKEYTGMKYSSDITRTSNVGSKVDFTGNLVISSKGDVNIKGSSISAKEALIKGKSVNVLAVKDVEDSKYESEKTEFAYSKEEKIEKHTETALGSSIKTQGNMTLIAEDGDITFKGSSREAGGKIITLAENGKLQDLAFELNNKYEREATESGFSSQTLGESEEAKNARQNVLDKDGVQDVSGTNAKLKNSSSAGIETDVDGLHSRGFINGTSHSELYASGSATHGFVVSQIEEKVNSKLHARTNIKAGEEIIIAKGDVVRESITGEISGDSFVKSLEGDVKYTVAKDEVTSNVFKNTYSVGEEYSYKIAPLEFAEKLKQKQDYSDNSAFSAKNAKAAGKETPGEGAEALARVGETMGHLSKLAGGEIANVSKRAGYNITTTNKHSESSTSLENELKIGGTQTIIGKNVTLEGVKGEIGNLNIKAKKLDVLAAKDTYKEDSFGYSYFMGNQASASVNSKGASVTGEGAFDLAVITNNTDSTTYQTGNIQVKNNVNLDVENDANLKGLGIKGKNIKTEIGGNLNIESLQNTVDHKAINVNVNASGGFTMSTAKGAVPTPTASVGATYGQETENKAWVKEQAGLVSTDEFDVNVGGKTTITGGKLGSETEGKTNFSTKELSITDLKDTHDRGGFYGGGGISGGKDGVDGVDIKFGTAEGYERAQTTKGTIGTGNIKVNGKEANLDGVNRDFENSQEKTKDKVNFKTDFDFSFDVPNKKKKNDNDDGSEGGSSNKKSSDNDSEHIYSDIDHYDTIDNVNKSKNYDDGNDTYNHLNEKTGESTESENIYNKTSREDSENIYDHTNTKKENTPDDTYSKISKEDSDYDDAISPKVPKDGDSEDHTYFVLEPENKKDNSQESPDVDDTYNHLNDKKQNSGENVYGENSNKKPEQEGSEENIYEKVDDENIYDTIDESKMDKNPNEGRPLPEIPDDKKSSNKAVDDEVYDEIDESKMMDDDTYNHLNEVKKETSENIYGKGSAKKVNPNEGRPLPETPAERKAREEAGYELAKDTSREDLENIYDHTNTKKENTSDDTYSKTSKETKEEQSTEDHPYFVLEPENKKDNSKVDTEEQSTEDHPYFVLEPENKKDNSKVDEDVDDTYNHLNDKKQNSGENIYGENSNKKPVADDTDGIYELAKDPNKKPEQEGSEENIYEKVDDENIYDTIDESKMDKNPNDEGIYNHLNEVKKETSENIYGKGSAKKVNPNEGRPLPETPAERKAREEAGYELAKDTSRENLENIYDHTNAKKENTSDDTYSKTSKETKEETSSEDHPYFVLEPENKKDNSKVDTEEQSTEDHPYFVLEPENKKDNSKVDADVDDTYNHLNDKKQNSGENIYGENSNKKPEQEGSEENIYEKVDDENIYDTIDENKMDKNPNDEGIYNHLNEKTGESPESENIYDKTSREDSENIYDHTNTKKENIQDDTYSKISKEDSDYDDAISPKVPKDGDSEDHPYFVLEPENKKGNSQVDTEEQSAEDHPYFVLEPENKKDNSKVDEDVDDTYNHLNDKKQNSGENIYGENSNKKPVADDTDGIYELAKDSNKKPEQEGSEENIYEKIDDENIYDTIDESKMDKNPNDEGIYNHLNEKTGESTESENIYNKTSREDSENIYDHTNTKKENIQDDTYSKISKEDSDYDDAISPKVPKEEAKKESDDSENIVKEEALEEVSAPVKRKIPKFLQEEEAAILNGETLKNLEIKEPESPKGFEAIKEKLSTWKAKIQNFRNKGFSNEKEDKVTKDTVNKLKNIADNAENIPKEHLLKALNDMTGLEVDNYDKLIRDPNTGNINPKAREYFQKTLTQKGLENKQVKKSLDKIFTALNNSSKEYKDVREKLNENLMNRLESNEEFKSLMNEKLTGDKEKLQKLFNIVEEAKFNSFKEITGHEVTRTTLKINDGGKLNSKEGRYLKEENEVEINESPFASFLRSKKANNEEILNTFIHELTHHEQEEFKKNKDSFKEQGIKDEADVFELNQKLYINPSFKDQRKYLNQPVEKEAFETADKLTKEIMEKTK